MNFDTVMLAAVAHELAANLTGARVDKITVPEPLDIVLSLYINGRRFVLLVSAEPDAARIHLTTRKSRPSPATPSAFCMLLRKYMEGGVIEDINEPLGFSERVLRIVVRGQSRERVNLWIELMGRQSNAILTNETGVILGSIKRVTPDMSRLREVRTGIKYTPPPRQAGYKRNPMEPNAFIGLPATEFAEYTQAANWLTASFSGVGTLLAREAVLRSASGKLTSESVWYGLNEVLSLVRLTEFSPVVYRDTRGDVAGAYPFRLRSIPDADQIDVDGISNAVESAYGSRLQENTLEKERTALLAALRKAAKACDRQLLDVREGLVNSDQSEHYKECGELLLANMNDLHPGASEMAVDDFYALEPNARRTISIDPSISIHDNAQRYFRRYQKARDSREILLSRQMQIEQSSQHIARAIEDAERISTASELSALTQAIAAEIRQPQSSATREATAKPAYDGHKIRSLKSPDGWEILVGENSTSNDYLTTKVASPSDIWLHARAVPSAHAVIRAQNRPASVSTAAILLAAEQVARRSTAKHAGLVSVDYTLKKYVRKPRGSAPGQVTYTNEKTIDVIADNDE